MDTFEQVLLWFQSSAEYVFGGTRYTNISTKRWVEIHPSATISPVAKIGRLAKIGRKAFVGDGSVISDFVTIGAGATIGDMALIGDRATIGSRANIKPWIKIGARAIIHKNAVIDESPVYVWPRGGDFPVYVSDPNKKLVGVGCSVLRIDKWFGREGAKVVADNAVPRTEKYEAALRAVAAMMGWEVPDHNATRQSRKRSRRTAKETT